MEIPEQLTINLTKTQKKNLLPFFATWLTYFILYMPFWGFPPASFGSVLFKVLPILSLCFYVILAATGFKDSFPTKDNLIPTNDRSRHFVFALLCSCLGDACLVWRELLFVPGLLFFAVAQLLYINGLQVDSSKSRTKSLYALFGTCIFMFIQSGISSYILTVLVGMYIALILVVGWRATARFEEERSKAALVGVYGAILFIFSDFVIAIDKWCFTVPFGASMVMSSYYGAQMCLALSTTQGLK